MSPQRAFKVSTSPHHNEYEQVCPLSTSSEPHRLYTLQRKKKQIAIKRNQTFNCAPVHTPIHNTTSYPRLSTKAKIQKKLSADSIYGYTIKTNRRTRLASQQSIQTGVVGCNVDGWQNITTTPNHKFRYKKNSMIETKKEYEYQRQFNRIPSVVIWHEPSVNNDVSSHESEDTREGNLSHSPSHENNNNLSNCQTKTEVHV